VHDTREVRRRIGYVFGGDRGLYDRLSGYDNLRYFADLYEIPWRTQRARITELLELVNLSGREHDRVEGYSRGMRQRLHIARGLLAKPSVLFLDEPSLGLDPEGARDLRVAVAALGEAGTTVILTTHYMAEADELCRRIAIIAGGRIVTVDAPGAIKQSTADLRVLEITSRQLPAEVLGIVRTLPGVIDARVEARDHVQLLSVRFAKDVEVQPRVMASLSGVVLDRVSEVTPSLEDAYLTILGRHSEGGEP
jgi:ABC-2 type transport system ATP-binding protein